MIGSLLMKSPEMLVPAGRLNSTVPPGRVTWPVPHQAVNDLPTISRPAGSKTKPTSLPKLIFKDHDSWVRKLLGFNRTCQRHFSVKLCDFSASLW